MKYKNILTILLSIALILSVLATAGVFEKGEIVLKKASQNQEVEVYIVGEIAEPGIYKIKKGSILNVLLEMAGGLNETVDKDNINLAYRIDDNMMIKVLNSSMISMEDEEGINVYDKELSSLMININTAGVEELILIPGVGDSTANAIIAYRNEYGDYNVIEDIMNVSGIKQSKFESIKDFICIK